MTVNQLVEYLKNFLRRNIFKRYPAGIEDSRALGVKMPDIRKLVKRVGVKHSLAMEIWHTADGSRSAFTGRR